jgi:hypothetical protein
MTVAGHVVVDHEGLEQGLYDHFCGVFGTAMSSRTMINFAALGIHPMPLAELDVDIQPDGVWNAIKELPPDRAPSLDGFIEAFYRSS